MANKGGIVVSLEYMKTKFTFLSAHLAAHKGESYYQARCKNVEDILRYSKTFDLSNISDIALASHHIFVFGDLNFRTKIVLNDADDKMETKGEECDVSMFESTVDSIIPSDNIDLEGSITESALPKKDISGNISIFSRLKNTNHAMQKNSKEKEFEHVSSLIREKDWTSLYSYDELSQGLKNGDLLVGFQTLPCTFSPTFKVMRTSGFKYKSQRIPSYTDRILHKSAEGLQSNVRQVAYEACADFITSDHKPIRGAYSIILNESIEAMNVSSKFQLILTELECSNLEASDFYGVMNPFVMFVWDSIDLKKRFSNHHFLSEAIGNKWPASSCMKKTFNPKWDEKKIILESLSCKVSKEALLYLLVFNKKHLNSKDFLGATCLNVQEIVSMEGGERRKQMYVDKSLDYYGKHAGKIKFKLQVKFLEDESCVKVK